MKYKIGVYGSAITGKERLNKLANAVGIALATNQVTIITGGGSGLPYIAAQTAHKNGAQVWGFPSAFSYADFKKQYPNLDHSVYSKLVYVSTNLPKARNIIVRKKYRNVTSTSYCDAGIIIAGRWGTTDEFSHLYDMGKVIGVLTGTGGIADQLSRLTKIIKKPNTGKVIFNKDPHKLIKKVVQTLKK